MKKFQALLTKDWQIHKKAILIPFWIIVGFYLINIVIISVAYFTGNLDSIVNDQFRSAPTQLISFMANSIFAIFPGILMLLFVIITTQSALNEDKKRKCELFHRTQPVSIWMRTASKLSVGIVGNYVVFIVITFINALVLNSIIASLSGFQFIGAINGLLISQINYLLSAIVIGSIAFFMSAVFENSAFFKFVAILVALNIIIMIINGIYGWHIPTPWKYFTALVKAIPLFSSEFSSETLDISEMIRENWINMVFSLRTLWQLLVSAALFCGGTYIYSRKEVS